MLKKITSLILSVCMIFSCVVFPSTAMILDTFSKSDFVSMYGAHLNYDSKITENEDGSYTILIDMYSSYAVNIGNINILSSEDGYYEVDREGKYLIELWGGDGATASGKGGAGGYVYGVMDLKEGDTLYYTLGGGGQTTSTEGQGGGANGGQRVVAGEASHHDDVCCIEQDLQQTGAHQRNGKTQHFRQNGPRAHIDGIAFLCHAGPPGVQKS